MRKSIIHLLKKSANIARSAQKSQGVVNMRTIANNSTGDAKSQNINEKPSEAEEILPMETTSRSGTELEITSVSSPSSGNAPATFSETDETLAAKGEEREIPEPPTTCCMSGCANCVWIDYAESLSRIYKDGGAKSREAIRKIPDPNIRAFIEMEFKPR